MILKNVTLELSGKAFRDDSERSMYDVCRKMFAQWRRLTDRADQVSILLRIADGSEILEYTGDLKQRFEWGSGIGCANPIPLPEGDCGYLKNRTHFFPKKYAEDAAPHSYSWLKRLIEIIRETGINNWQGGMPPDQVESRMTDFLDRFRKLRPSTPVIVITPLWVPPSWKPRKAKFALRENQAAITRAALKYHCRVINGGDLTEKMRSCLTASPFIPMIPVFCRFLKNWLNYCRLNKEGAPCRLLTMVMLIGIQQMMIV